MFAVKGEHGRALLAGLIAWAQRSASPSSPPWRGPSATNTDLRAYGFHSAGALITMADLTRGGLRPDLPAR